MWLSANLVFLSRFYLGNEKGYSSDFKTNNDDWIEYRFILECMNSTTEIRRNPCNNSEATSHALGVKLNTLNEPEPIWEMYSKSWKIKESIYIAIRTRVEVYGDISTVLFNTPTNIYIF